MHSTCGESPSRDSPTTTRRNAAHALPKAASDAQADTTRSTRGGRSGSLFLFFFSKSSREIHRADFAGQGALAAISHLPFYLRRATPRSPPVSRAANDARICASDSRESGYSISLLNCSPSARMCRENDSRPFSTDGSSSCCGDDDDDVRRRVERGKCVRASTPRGISDATRRCSGCVGDGGFYASSLVLHD